MLAQLSRLIAQEGKEKKMLRWDWNAKVGEIEFEDEQKVNLYEGNAFLIMLYEYEKDGDELWDMYSFFVDKAHAKRCLGLVKDKYTGEAENIYRGAGWKRVILFADKMNEKTRKDLVELLLKAMPDVEIVLTKAQ